MGRRSPAGEQMPADPSRRSRLRLGAPAGQELHEIVPVIDQVQLSDSPGSRPNDALALPV